MPFQLYDDFLDLLASFNKVGVKYMVVGGYAVIFHGYNRFTGDLDIWVEQSPENFKLISSAFNSFGIPSTAISETDFLQNEKDVFTFGRPPVCFEILTSVKGLTFADTYSRIKTTGYQGLEIRIIDLVDLIKAKKAAGRHKDLDDIEHLKE